MAVTFKTIESKCENFHVKYQLYWQENQSLISHFVFYSAKQASEMAQVWWFIRCFAPHQRVQDNLGFCIPRNEFQIPLTGFLNFRQWNLDSGFSELYSGF